MARVALITGGTDGIGKATARRLLSDGWDVVITGRNAAKTDATLAELKDATGKASISALVADLSVMEDVRRAATEFLATHQRLDVLLLNANAITERHTLTREGFEANFAIGYLGRVLLLRALEPVLRATERAQVLSVVGLNLARMDFDDPTLSKKFSSMRALGLWQWAMQLYARHHDAQGGVPLNVFMPGLVKTKILANEPQPMRLIVQIANVFMGLAPEKSAAEVAFVLEDVATNGRRDAYYARTKLKPRRDLKELPGDTEKLLALTDRLLAPWR